MEKEQEVLQEEPEPKKPEAKYTVVKTLQPAIYYKSEFYTVARVAAVIKSNRTGREIPISAEGIARRSYKDQNNPERGMEIAIGRAEKSLAKKLKGIKPHHPLMN